VPAGPSDLTLAFNPLAPDPIEDPYPLYARLRRERPVFHSPIFDLWVVTRYADISEVERETARYSSVGALEARAKPHPEVRDILKPRVSASAASRIP
jgi:cytochrome P450